MTKCQQRKRPGIHKTWKVSETLEEANGLQDPSKVDGLRIQERISLTIPQTLRAFGSTNIAVLKTTPRLLKWGTIGNMAPRNSFWTQNVSRTKVVDPKTPQSQKFSQPRLETAQSRRAGQRAKDHRSGPQHSISFWWAIGWDKRPCALDVNVQRFQGFGPRFLWSPARPQPLEILSSGVGRTRVGMLWHAKGLTQQKTYGSSWPCQYVSCQYVAPKPLLSSRSHGRNIRSHHPSGSKLRFEVQKSILDLTWDTSHLAGCNWAPGHRRSHIG